jgi:hypothetical protein
MSWVLGNRTSIDYLSSPKAMHQIEPNLCLGRQKSAELPNLFLLLPVFVFVFYGSVQHIMFVNLLSESVNP